MPRRSRNQITAELAKVVIKKLKAKQNGECVAHKHFDVYTVDGKKYLTTLSLRHGADSKKNQGHDHMINQLGVNSYYAKELGRCNRSRVQWIKEFEKNSD